MAIRLEEIRLLKQSDKSTVLLMREIDGEKLYVKKILQGHHAVYEILPQWQHRYLPEVIEVTFTEDCTTVLEAYIEGQTLAHAELDFRVARTAILELCDVLGFLHSKGVIHRDIKPSNIILASDGHIRLIDFDAARMARGEGEQDTQLLGTRNYAPPEQYGFAQTDERADIYALGVTMRELLSVKAGTLQYRKIIEKCTSLDPNKRYRSVGAVRRAMKWSTPLFCGVAVTAVAMVLVIALRPPPAVLLEPSYMSIDDAYDDMVVEYALTPGADDDRYAIQDILGDQLPELIIWGEDMVAKAIFGYDLARGQAYQYQGDTAIQNPEKGRDGCCISARVDDGGAQYIVYGASDWTLGALCRLDITPTGYAVNGIETNRSEFQEIAYTYLESMPDIEVWYDEEGSQKIDLNEAHITQINMFLSAFIETNSWSFQNHVDDLRCVDFALTYCLFNYPERAIAQKKDGLVYEGFDLEEVRKWVNYFFNQDMERIDRSEYLIEDGTLFRTQTKSEKIACLAQVSNPITYHEGAYHVSFRIYQMKHGLLPNTELYRPVDTWASSERDAVSYLHDVVANAVLMPRGQAGLDSFYLDWIEVSKIT